MDLSALVTTQNIRSGLAVLILGSFQICYPFIVKAIHKYESYWVSFSSGIAIGYVCLYLLPKLSHYTILIIEQRPAVNWQFLNFRVYIFLLIGLIIYLVLKFFTQQKIENQNVKLSVFSFIAYCLYSIIIGELFAYMFHLQLFPLILATVAICFHYFGINHQFYHWDKHIFKKYIRWLFAFSIIVGWFIGVFSLLPNWVIVASTAFLSGGIIANVMYDEISENKPTLTPFLTGVITIFSILVIVASFPEITG